jgi:flagellar biosynthesis GTPase FlhF
MQIRKFQGRNMRESIEMMRREIGEEGIILSTQEVVQNGIPMTELIAGIHPEDLEQLRDQRTNSDVYIPDEILHAAGGKLGGIDASEASRASHPAHSSRSQHVSNRFASRPPVRGAASAPQAQDHSGDTPEMSRQLDEIHAALQNLASIQRFRFTSALPEAFKSVYEELREAGYTEEQAMFYIGNISSRGVGATVKQVREACARLIESSVRSVNPIRSVEDRNVFLVLGAPGSGKSTLCSMISQSLHLMIEASSTIYTHGSVNADAGGAADVRVESYTNLEQLTALMTSNHQDDVSLVEMSLNPKDVVSKAQLESLLEVLQPDAVLIALPSGSNAKRVQSWMSLAESIDNCSFVLTGVDVDGLPGETIYELAQRDLPLSFLTFGAHSFHALRAAGGKVVSELIFKGCVE